MSTQPLQFTPTPWAAKLLESYAIAHDVTEEEAMSRLFQSVELLQRFKGSLRLLGRDWEEAEKQQKSTPQAPAQPPKKRGRPARVEPDLTEEQLSLLQRASCKSGFAGVYSNRPHGWRAQVYEDNKPHWLRTHKKPENAAWERYVYLQTHGSSGQPVNSLEQDILDTMEYLRSRHPDHTEEQLRDEAEKMEKYRRM